MKSKRLWQILAAGALVAAAGAGGYSWWRRAAMERTGAAALGAAREALDAGHPRETLRMLDAAAVTGGNGQDRQALEIAAAAAALDVDRLMRLFDRAPEAVMANEEAAMLCCRVLERRGDSARATQLVREWSSRSTQRWRWTAVRVDALMGRGEGSEAAAYLADAAAWQGAPPAARLVRQALIKAPSDLAGAWDLLTRASREDPRNADVRSFRGQIMEAAGRLQEARVEYVAALVAEPESPLRRDQLASFHVRCGAYDHAVKTWMERPFDFTRLKGQFWARVAAPRAAEDAPPWKSPATGAALSRGDSALMALELTPPGRWTGPVDESIRAQSGEMWWLHVLDLLKDGDEAAAAPLLAAPSPAAVQLAADLLSALRTVLALRADRPLQGIVWSAVPRGLDRPSWFAALARRCADERSGADTKSGENEAAFAKHPAAIAHVFAVAGWREAALRLCDWSAQRRLPASVRYTMAQCLAANRSAGEAVTFLQPADESPLIVGLTGELLLAAGRRDEGIVSLARAAKDDSGAGRRAAWVLCQVHLEAGDSASARAVFQAAPGFAATPEGMAMAGKLELAAGNSAAADRQFAGAAAAGSIEGRIREVRQLMATGNKEAAMESAMKLRSEVPDAMAVRALQLSIEDAMP